MTLKIEQDEVLRMALEALEELHYSSGTVVAARKYELATAALREALASRCLTTTTEQAEQEPVAWVDKERMQSIAWLKTAPEHGTKLYAAPLAKQDTHATHVVRTKDLTDDEIADIVYEMNGNEPTAPFWRDLARAVISADRAKNLCERTK